MRKDILINIQTGDLQFASKQTYSLMPFKWVDGDVFMLEAWKYGEVETGLERAQLVQKGCYVTIPYTPECKDVAVRFKLASGHYLLNPVNGSKWFAVKVHGQTTAACKLIAVTDGDFYLRFEGNQLDVNLYAASQTDVVVGNANRQNGNLLLSCCPTNNYRYPLLGVGMSYWINGNMASRELAEKISKEFSSDGVAVSSVRYDTDTKQIYMRSKVKEDGGEDL